MNYLEANTSKYITSPAQKLNTSTLEDPRGSAQTVEQRKAASSSKVRLSLKIDLTPEQIPTVARSLIRSDAIAFLLTKCALVRDLWAASEIKATSTTDSIVAAFDAVRFPTKDNGEPRLFLRFAYIQLVKTIDTLINISAAKRYTDKANLDACKRDTSRLLDIYLNAKGIPLTDRKLRDKLSKHITMGRRWFALGGSTLFWLSLYTNRAETTMYVPSFSMYITFKT